jgi:hypothetical protein
MHAAVTLAVVEYTPSVLINGVGFGRENTISSVPIDPLPPDVEQDHPALDCAQKLPIVIPLPIA